MLLSRRLRFLRALCWVGVFGFFGTVHYLSSRGAPELAEDLPFFMAMWDKGLHFAAFFCGALPLVPALRLSTEWPWKKIILVAVLILSAYGAIDEVHQTFTPSRTGLSPGDWFADTLGALVGTAFTAFIHAFCERKNSPAPEEY